MENGAKIPSREIQTRSDTHLAKSTKEVSLQTSNMDRVHNMINLVLDAKVHIPMEKEKATSK